MQNLSLPISKKKYQKRPQKLLILSLKLKIPQKIIKKSYRAQSYFHFQILHTPSW